MTRKNKSTSFDLADEFERKLFEHVESLGKGKYSKYVKRLIANDIEGRQVRLVSVATSTAPVKRIVEDDDDSIEGFL